jgi:hypothetical protein
MFKINSLIVSTFAVLILAVSPAFAGKSDDNVWQGISDSGLKKRSAERLIVPNVYSTFRVDKSALNSLLDNAPREFSEAARTEEVIMTIPMPDGTFSRFRIQNSPIMEPELAAKYPEINSYLGQGIDNPNATVRFDMSPVGFRAMILSTDGTTLIEPYAKGDTSNYISFNKKNVEGKSSFQCEVTGNPLLDDKKLDLFNFELPTKVINGTTLRTYRLAMAATGEYTTYFRQAGDTDEQAKARALAAIVTTMNRVNGVYERDLAVRMVLVANTDLLIYTNAATDPYTNTSGDLGANNSNINSVIGTANYDIGHLVGTGGGGVAQLRVPCGSNKASGLTGQSNPVGDPFDIDYVAHEIGHQFGGNHTFNGSVGNCAGGNRSAGAAYETGSGITIMAYAGICGNQNLARNSIDTFHVKSLEEITAFINGAGNSCSANTATNNNPPAIPTLVSGSTFNIPRQTPFALNATTTDANNDSVTYDWQEYNLGALTTTVPNTDATGGARPIFRPYLPTASGIRYFPSLQYILNNANVPPSTYSCAGSTCLTGELLPAITRVMTFQVVARDNRAGGGGINSATSTVNVDATSGPFAITFPNINVGSVPNDTPTTITWNVANTTNSTVNAANVKISLSTDGGQTFPRVLANSTPNDGTETLFLGVGGTTTARIKIEAVNNIFFDISDADFVISALVGKTPFDFDGDGKADISLYRNGIWYLQRSQAGFSASSFGITTDKTVAADYDGDNRTDIAVFRGTVDASLPDFYVLRSSNSTVAQTSWGTVGDIPIAGDFDGDNKADYAVYRAGTWYINGSNGTTRTEQFGLATDKPVAADYDGDNKTDLAVYRNGVWYQQRSALGFTAIQFGIANDLPIPADFDGDAKADLAVYRSGTWYLLRSIQGFTATQFGIATDIPAPADYDGDGRADISVFRPSEGNWYSLRSSAGIAITNFGLNGDKPIPAQNN